MHNATYIFSWILSFVYPFHSCTLPPAEIFSLSYFPVSITLFCYWVWYCRAGVSNRGGYDWLIIQSMIVGEDTCVNTLSHLSACWKVCCSQVALLSLFANNNIAKPNTPQYYLTLTNAIYTSEWDNYFECCVMQSLTGDRKYFFW